MKISPAKRNKLAQHEIFILVLYISANLFDSVDQEQLLNPGYSYSSKSETPSELLCHHSYLQLLVPQNDQILKLKLFRFEIRNT